MNIPTFLTALRIVGVLAFAVVLVWPFGAHRWLAFAIFVVAALTDWFDGYLARKLNQTTAFGRMLDSIADKMLVSVGLLMLCAEGSITGVHALAAALIVVRETWIAGLREHLAGHEVVLPPSLLAKWKTTFQLIALGALILAGAVPQFPFVQMVGIITLWAAAILTLVTGWDYLRVGISHMD